VTSDRFSRELLSIRSDISLMLGTGFSEKINGDTARSLGVRGFLIKPLLPRDVAHLIRSVLNGLTIP
jgi:two-component system cell cycle sensor histidine kinase/response regulator CckA